MPEADFLLATAEVSIAFAGFSGVVAVFGSPRSGDWTVTDAVRLRLLLGYSVGALFASLLPFIPYHAGLSGSTVWSISSALLALAIASFLVLSSRGYRQLRRASGRPSTLLNRIVGVGLVGFVPILSLNALGFGLHRLPWIYLAAILWALFCATAAFIRLLTPMWSAPAGE